ncbi:MAG: antibiotic biosynthesis monooxygenase [Stappiaceae bacterium]
MIAVIFEVEPHSETRGSYLETAAELAEHLHKMDGFISVERFQSLSQPEKLLSLSYWRDEQAVADWRNLPVHRNAQNAGRSELFANYRLRVTSVLRDYGLNDREQAPQDSRNKHDL